MTRPASNGSIIGAIQEPSPTSAGGIWTLPAQYELQKEGKWIAPGYNISRSLRFNSADSAYLNRTPASAGNRKTWTWSGWVKRSGLGGFEVVFAAGNVSDQTTTLLFFESTGKLCFQGWSGASAPNATTTAVFRDFSAWYHIVAVFNSPNATANDRMILYVNNVRQALSTNLTPTQDLDWGMNNNWIHTLGSASSSQAGSYLGGYLADVHFIDGTALTPSSFGVTDTTTGVWRPKQYTGFYGTNGFYLNFSDNSGTTSTTLGKDSSSNGNNWTPNNFSVTAGAGNDSLVDTPTPYGTDTGVGGTVRGNYCTLNPLNANSSVTLSNGNLNLVTPSSGYGMTYSTFGMSSGKWYWEVTVVSNSGGADIGINKTSVPLSEYMGQNANSWAYLSNANKRNNNSASSYGASFTDNDVIGVALDLDAGTLVFYKNGASQGTAYSSLSGEFFPAFSDDSNGAGVSLAVNFGQRPFAYTAPSGFKALCTQNLPTPTVVQGDDYFNTVLYTGDSSARTITGVGFQPDFSWIKIRNAVDNHYLFDAVRGKGATYMKTLYSNSTSAESPGNNTSLDVGVTDFASDGFTFGSGALNGNQSPYTFVAWNWNAGGSTVTNTAGTVSSQVRANTTSGFSVVTWTGSSAGQTVGHGLGVAPSLIITKTRNNAGENWPVYHRSLGKGSILFLNTTDSVNTVYPTYWGNSEPSSTIFGTFTGGYPAGNNYGNMVAYCFAAIPGYSAFGSYTGNGSADGPFVYLGFRPAFLLVKRSSSSGEGWWIYDSKRDTFNIVDNILEANSSGAESSGGTYPVDFLSNGWKIRGLNGLLNTSGATYIYAAFAENPFKYSLAR